MKWPKGQYSISMAETRFKGEDTYSCNVALQECQSIT